jgi:hypothetical protein
MQDSVQSGSNAHQKAPDGAQAKTAQAAELAQEKASEAGDAAQEKAQQAAGQVQARLREQIDQRSSHVAAQVNEQASDLRAVGQSLRDQGKEGPARAADQLAGYAEKVGGYLQDKDGQALLSDAEDFGRRQPLAVAAGGLILGFAASRFLKASSGRRYRQRTTTPHANGVYAGGDGSPSVRPPAVTAGAVPGVQR